MVHQRHVVGQGGGVAAPPADLDPLVGGSAVAVNNSRVGGHVEENGPEGCGCGQRRFYM